MIASRLQTVTRVTIFNGKFLLIGVSGFLLRAHADILLTLTK